MAAIHCPVKEDNGVFDLPNNNNVTRSRSTHVTRFFNWTGRRSFEVSYTSLISLKYTIISATNMITISRSLLRSLRDPRRPLCSRCHRCLSQSAPLQSGHSRWSKIKHDKAVTDSRKGKALAILAKEIEDASRRMLSAHVNLGVCS